MTTSTIITCFIVIPLVLLSIPLIRSSLAKKRQREEEYRIQEAKYVTEKEKIRVYLDRINEDTRKKYR